MYGTSRSNNGFAGLAATVSLLSPLLVIALGQLLKHAAGSLQASNLAIAALVVGGLSCLLMVTGLILGILALLLMRPGGRTSIVIRSLLGLTVTGLLVVMAVPNYLQVRARVQTQLKATTDVLPETTDPRQQSAASLTNHASQPTNLSRVQPARLARVEPTSGTASQTSPGDTANVLRAGQAYARHLQAVLADYQDAHDALVSARVLSTSNLVDRGAIAERRAVVEKFLARNDALRDFINQGSTNYRAELLAFHASDAGMASALAGFEKGAAIQQRSLLADIRTQDDRIGAAMLGVLGLLDTDWGHWHYTADTPHLRFENRADLDQYDTYLTEIREAGLVQAATQRQLAGAIQQTAAR